MSQEEDYSNWSKSDLQAELENRGVEAAGPNKDDLIAALEADDAGQTVEPDGEESDGVVVSQTEKEEEVATTSHAATRIEGTTASETPPDEGDGPHASDAGAEAYPFPTQGDVDVSTVDPGTGEGEFFVPPAIDDWVLLDGSAEEVPDRFDGHRAVILAVTAPSDEPVAWDERENVTLTVRTRDEANSTMDIPFSAVKEVIKGGVSGTVRG